MKLRSIHLAIRFSLAFCALAFTTTNAALEYNRDVRPILSENCFACHGPDAASRKAKLRLDRFEDATASRTDGRAIVPGKPEESAVIQRITTTDPDDLMPPPESHKQLTQTQKDILRQWISNGAHYQPHWAYMKIVRPSPPRLADTKWVRNPVDAFILQNLRAKKVTPSPEADKSRLLRRLSLDLLGLPPTAQELKRFLKDTSSKAYEREVDRLLASPHFGERMAVAWLDQVRFADTVGYHADQPQNSFPYRDYVIDAFNRNKSFADFTIEQIAGDLLPNATEQQKTATCFNRLNMMTREGGTQQKEYLIKYTADRVRTVSGAWLGSTMGCAECHDHKFDPFSMKDFYGMGAFFADIKQWGLYADYVAYTPNPELRGYDYDHFFFPPEIEVDNQYLQDRRKRMLQTRDELIAASNARLKSDARQQESFAEWRREMLAFLKENPTGWIIPEPEIHLSKKGTNVVTKDYARVGGDATITLSNDAREDIRITIPVSGWVAAVKLEVVPRTNAITKFGQWPLPGATTTLKASRKANKDKESPVPFLYAEADRKQQDYHLGVPIAGVKDRWRTSTNQELHTAVYLLEQPFRAGTNDFLVLNLGTPGLISVRASVSPLAAQEPLDSGRVGQDFAKALAKKRAPAEVATTYFLSTGWDTNTLADVRKNKLEAWQCREGRSRVMVAESWEPMTIRVLARGNWQDESGEIMQPSVPRFLPQLDDAGNRPLTRLDLGRWLVSPDNPLTARTFVNRLWKQFFGVGISAVADDLGAQGEWPVFPELLDWLAAEFMTPAYRPQSAHAWNIKHAVKLIVMSSAYRQDSNERQDVRELDPGNRWVSFQSPRRLEAEFVRDNALMIAGLLNRDVGGPSAYPYQPADYYANLQFPTRVYQASLDDRQYRRGLYTHWQRAYLHPMLANFDAPAREECTANRTVSNTPQQGLTLLNDPTFVEASRVFAQRLLSLSRATDAQRLELAFELAVARSIKAREKESLLRFLAEQRTHYQEHSGDAEKLSRVGLAPTPGKLDQKELAAWSNLCRVILNLHETITRY